MLLCVGCASASDPVPVRPTSPEAVHPTSTVSAAPVVPPSTAPVAQPQGASVEPPIMPSEPLPAPSTSTSIGTPGEGRIEGAAALPLRGRGFRFNDRRDSNARFAAAEVIGAIARAAARVDEQLPGSELVVNDISLERGGPIDHHGSHRAGRDADILFYLLGDDGQPTPSVGAPIDREGIGFDYKDLAIAEDDVRVHFDAPRTWRFVASLLSDPEASVQRIFVVEHLRELLLSEADKHASDHDARERFAEITCQPSYPHDDHLHVRWFCSAEDLAQGCQDLPPLYPWRKSELLTAGAKPVMGALRKERPRSKIVTHEDEDREVAKLVIHPAVRAFLARRKLWREQPHPGRKYCP